MLAETRVRRWARRAVVVVAALACVATSPAPWYVEAKLPEGRAPQSLGTRLTVGASRLPSAYAKRVGDQHALSLAHEPQGDWSGKGTFYLPPGFVLDKLSISGHDCSSGGGMCSACVPPLGTSVQLASMQAVAPWSLTASSALLDVHVEGTSAASIRIDVSVQSSGPVDLEVVASGAGLASDKPSIYNDKARDASGSSHYRVFISQVPPATGAMGDDGKLPSERSPLTDGTLTVRATLYGYCPTSTDPCQPPPGAAVQIVSADLVR